MLKYDYFILKEEKIGDKKYLLVMNNSLYGKDSGRIQFLIIKKFNNIKTTILIKEFKNCTTKNTIRAKKQRMNKEFYSLINYLKEKGENDDDLKNNM